MRNDTDDEEERMANTTEATETTTTTTATLESEAKKPARPKKPHKAPTVATCPAKALNAVTAASTSGHRAAASANKSTKTRSLRLSSQGTSTSEDYDLCTIEEPQLPSTSMAPCRPDVCHAIRNRHLPPDLTDSPWHPSKTVFLLITIGLLAVWLVVYITLSQLKIV